MARYRYADVSVKKLDEPDRVLIAEACLVARPSRNAFQPVVWMRLLLPDHEEDELVGPVLQEQRDEEERGLVAAGICRKVTPELQTGNALAAVDDPTDLVEGDDADVPPEPKARRGHGHLALLPIDGDLSHVREEPQQPREPARAHGELVIVGPDRSCRQARVCPSNESLDNDGLDNASLGRYIAAVIPYQPGL